MPLEVNNNTIIYPEQKRSTPFGNAPFVDEFLNYAKDLQASPGKISLEKLLLALTELSEHNEIRGKIAAESVFTWRESEKIDFKGLKRDLIYHTANYIVTMEDEEYAAEILRKSYDDADKENYLWYTFSHILFAVLDHPTAKIKEILQKNKF